MVEVQVADADAAELEEKPPASSLEAQTAAADDTSLHANGEDEEDDDDDMEETEGDACCICQDGVEALMQGHLPSCEHRFHFDCIVAWAKVTNLCPLCKTKFNVVTRVDAQGAVTHSEAIADHKQVFRPDPRDHDIAAQLRLVNQARCELCGSGEDEHVLLMCEAPGCGVANHTYCIGLHAVPNNSWYCSQHALTQRASDMISRPATTVSTRRRTRRLASLMSNVLSGGRDTSTTRSTRRTRGRGRAGATAVNGEERRPLRGIAAAYALRMSRELQQVQMRADAMFARGDLTQPALYEPTARSSRLAGQGTRSTVATSAIDHMWQDHSRSRQELAAAAFETGRAQQEALAGGSSTSNGRVSKTFTPEYRELSKLMLDAVSHDDYASSVALSIPKTAKLRLVSRVKTFFGRLNAKEKLAALEVGCLSVLHQWLRTPKEQDAEASDTSSGPNAQVLEAVLTILDTLPVRKEDLLEESGLQSTMNTISKMPGVSIEMRERAEKLSKRWRELNPPASKEEPRIKRSREVAPPEDTGQNLPVITAFSSPKRPRRSNHKRKRKHEAWSDKAVEYVKAKLYPLYKQGSGAGSLTKERFKAIVKQVLTLFEQEAAAMQSTLLLPTGELSSLAKTRLKKLIDQVYKAGVASSRSSTVSSSSLPLGQAATAYSAVPSVKSQRRS